MSIVSILRVTGTTTIQWTEGGTIGLLAAAAVCVATTAVAARGLRPFIKAAPAAETILRSKPADAWSTVEVLNAKGPGFVRGGIALTIGTAFSGVARGIVSSASN